MSFDESTERLNIPHTGPPDWHKSALCLHKIDLSLVVNNENSSFIFTTLRLCCQIHPVIINRTFTFLLVRFYWYLIILSPKKTPCVTCKKQYKNNNIICAEIIQQSQIDLPTRWYLLSYNFVYWQITENLFCDLPAFLQVLAQDESSRRILLTQLVM